MRSRLVMVACAALVLSVGAATAAAGGGGDAKKKCKNGGWETFFRDDATTFRNQTACVSYVQHGGKLYTTVADISFNVVVTPGSAAVTVSNSGPSDATVSALVTYQGSCASGTISVASGTPVPAGGTASLNIVNGTGCTLNFYGQVTASDAADPDSKPNNYKNGFIGPPHEDDEAVWSLTP